MQSSSLGRTHTLTLCPGPLLLVSRLRACPPLLQVLEPRWKRSPGPAYVLRQQLKGSPGRPAPPPSLCLRGGSDYSKATRPVTGRAGTTAQSYCWLAPPPPPASCRHSRACGAHRRSGGAPSDRSPGSGSVAGCAGSGPRGTGNGARCLLHSAVAGGQTLEPGAALVEAHRTLQGGHSQELGACGCGFPEWA